jgi:hypothetical protein
VAAVKKAEAEDADERTKSIKTKIYELIKTSVPFVSADGFEFSLRRLNGGAAG